MDRKQFLKTCGLGCLGGLATISLLEGCVPSRSVGNSIDGDNLLISVDDFGDDAKGFRKFVIVHNDLLKFPICIFRLTATAYSALWMECSHMGAELQVFGDTIQCPAHGSEFTDRGAVRTGPADRPLRTFPVVIENNYLKVSLKK